MSKKKSCICIRSGLSECLYEDTDSETRKKAHAADEVGYVIGTEIPQSTHTAYDYRGKLESFELIYPVLSLPKPEADEKRCGPDCWCRAAEPKPKADSAQAAEILRKYADTLEERGKTYDKADGTSSMDRAVAAFNVITGHSLSEGEGWLLMLALKLSRQWANTDRLHEDSVGDAAAFVGLMGVALKKADSSKQEAR